MELSTTSCEERTTTNLLVLGVPRAHNVNAPLPPDDCTSSTHDLDRRPYFHAPGQSGCLRQSDRGLVGVREGVGVDVGERRRPEAGQERPRRCQHCAQHGGRREDW